MGLARLGLILGGVGGKETGVCGGLDSTLEVRLEVTYMVRIGSLRSILLCWLKLSWGFVLYNFMGSFSCYVVSCSITILYAGL